MIYLKTPIYRHKIVPMIALCLYTSSIPAHAAIISDNNERRIQIRQDDGATGTPLTPANSQPLVGDSMQGLIAQKQREFARDASLSIEENKRVNITRRAPTYNTTYSDGKYSTTSNPYTSDRDATNIDFTTWLNSNSYRARQVAEYQRYLSVRVGAQNVPPLSQLLTTARSWSKCGYEPYQLPPQELWPNIVPTLRLYSELKYQGVLPSSSEIRSVYRNPGLNDCAGGADSSKHMNASAIDIWVPEYEDNLWRLSTMQDGLCQFWKYQGEGYDFGLGLYATGAIHLDTDGYRKWGFQHASSGSFCRY